MSSTKPRSVAELVDLVGVMRRADGFADVREALSRGESAAIDGAWGSSCALAAAALAGGGQGGKTRSEADQKKRKTASATPGNGELDDEPHSGPVLLVVLPRI